MKKRLGILLFSLSLCFNMAVPTMATEEFPDGWEGEAWDENTDGADGEIWDESTDGTDGEIWDENTDGTDGEIWDENADGTQGEFGEDTGDGEYAGTEGTAEVYRLTDGADLLTEQDEMDLLAKLDEISLRQMVDIVVVTVSSLDGLTAEAYADDFYDYNGYGQDGILFLVSIEDRDWWISTVGYGETAMTEDDLEYVSESILEYLSEDNYADACFVFAELCDEIITNAVNNEGDVGQEEPDGNDNEGKAPSKKDDNSFPVVSSTLLSTVIGFITSFFVTKKDKNQLKTVHPQRAAGAYVKSGSMQVADSYEFFLYSKVESVEKQKNQNENGTNASRSTNTHTSSAGVNHGGRGGKF